MKKWIFCTALWIASAAQAHEFWITPDRFSPPIKAPVELSLWVGENFVGDPVGFGQPLVTSMRWYSKRGEVQLTPQLKDNLNQSSVRLAFDQPGTQLLALDSQPFTIELTADKFTAYLRDEGLERVIAQREASGQAAKPGLERYRRHVKTLLRVGGKTDAGFDVRTGQTLEIVPLADPQALKPGNALPLQLMFNGAPLEGALVKVWNHRGAQVSVLRTRTDAAGKSSTILPWGGVWMVSVVHMVPTTDGQGQDWDSHWGNLTFEMPSKPERR
jgi:uncharacterized GH25 family protein